MPVRVLSAGLTTAALVWMLAWGAAQTGQRNSTWSSETERYRVLATELKRTLPEIPKGSRLLIYDGVWDGFPVWPEAVVRTVYKDPSLTVVNVSGGRTPGQQTSDIAVRYLGHGFARTPVRPPP